MGPRRDEDDDRGRRWLLKSFEQRVGGLVAQSIGFVDDEKALPAFVRLVIDLFRKSARLRDFDVLAVRFNQLQVAVSSGLDPCARRAPIATVRGKSTANGGNLTIAGLGHGERELPLADAFGTGKDDGRWQAPVPQQPLQYLFVTLVADEFSERHITVSGFEISDLRDS